LALRYLRETGQVAPEIEMKATQFVNLGYQRLLNFESPSGGFNWWGNSEPGNMLLTGFGIQQFEDMGKVYEIDHGIIERSKRWLASKQNSDGSWNPTTKLHGYNMALGASKLRTTAYILWSLEQAGDKGGHIGRAVGYITKHLDDAKGDLYTLALAANALVLWNKSDSATLGLLTKLHDARVVDEKEKTVSWPTKGDTAMYSRGSSAAIETTALIAMAMINAKRYTSDANGALTYLVKSKGAYGNWNSTQATILALKALLLGMGGVGGDADMSAEILVDGKRVGREAFNPDNSDVMRIIDAGAVAAGSHKVEIKSHGKANVMYQVVGRYYRPWREVGGKAEPLTVKVEYDRRQLKVDDLLTARVSVNYNLDRTTFMVIVDLGIPPGFSVIPDDFASLVSQNKIKRYSLTGRQVTLYLGEMRKDTPLKLSYKLRARFPIKAKTPTSVAYEYYTPSSRGVQQPVMLTVDKE
jgi:uncharacterized protein YfaS (alpha-2-macroglobulin family)